MKEIKPVLGCEVWAQQKDFVAQIEREKRLNAAILESLRKVRI